MIKARLKKLRFATFGFLILLLALSPVSSVFAVGFGHGFYGTVKVGGMDADIGTVISAQVAGTEYGSCIVTTSGSYALIVQDDIAEGATIHFYVDGQEADQDFLFHDGWTTELNLTATTSEEEPLPSPFPFPCFIATAAYGTPTAEQIDVLREFRDVVLLESTVGSQFVFLYYQLSPPVAEFIAGNELLRTLVREFLIDPIVWVVEATEDIWQTP